MAVVGGETVIQEQSEDRCPDCAVGAVAAGNAVRVYQPELPKSLRGMDPRLQSALGAVARLPEEARDAIMAGAKHVGIPDLSEPAPPPTPVLPDEARVPVPDRPLLDTAVQPTIPSWAPKQLGGDVVDADHVEVEP